MVSTVEGELREDATALDLVRASFPPGSMTGAPKIAAMRDFEKKPDISRHIAIMDMASIWNSSQIRKKFEFFRKNALHSNAINAVDNVMIAKYAT